MLSRRPILGGSFAALLSTLVASARAEEPVYGTTWSQEALAGLNEASDGQEAGSEPEAAGEPSAAAATAPATAEAADGPASNAAPGADAAEPSVEGAVVAGAGAAGAAELATGENVPRGAAEPPESTELRMLRLAEEELFTNRARCPAADDAASCARRTPPPPEAPPHEFERDGKKIDVSFLKGLKLPGIPVRWDARVVEYLLFFKDDPRGRELAAGWLKRHERYGPELRKILSEHGLPPDLQYVAMVESGYDPRARSAVDAYGMWQFVQQPAEFYGLRIDHWVDERLDPERSTRAAARFMRDLHERFGTWELAFAAYNMGYGGLLRAIRKYNTNDYWLLSHLEAGLPFETALYVAKITAMALVAHNPAAFGFAKLTQEPPLRVVKVDVLPGSSLAQIAAAAAIPLEELAALNPHLKRSRVPPGEPSAHVYLPRAAQVRFAQRWSAQRDAQPVAHVLRFGETMEEVARRAGITTLRLRELNELATDARVAPGFALLVPQAARQSAEPQEPLVASVPDREFRYEGRERLFYRVAPGDTTTAVARLFNVALDELHSWNNLSDGAALQAGMLLQLFVAPERDLSRAVVYRPSEVRILTVGSDAFFDYHESQRGRVRVRYRVQPNDNLGALAERFDLSVGSIARINQFASQRELTAGEWVTVYVAEDELDKLARSGVIERISAAVADAQPSAEESERELPEEEGEPLLKPRKEGPITPPRKTRATVGPSKPSAKPHESAPKVGTPRAR